MRKRVISLSIALLISAIFIGCSSKPPYDARAIDESELDSPAQQERSTPAAGGGKALKKW